MADVVLDASALVVYAENDLQALAVDELLRELREDSGGAVLIPWFALEDAQQILRDDRAALQRLESLAAAHGVRLADANIQRAVEVVSSEGKVSRGMAQAMLLTLQCGGLLATYSASTLQGAGFDAASILDLDDVFPPG